MEIWSLTAVGAVAFIFAYIMYWSKNLDNWKELKLLRRLLPEYREQALAKSKVLYLENDQINRMVTLRDIDRTILIDTLIHYENDYENVTDDHRSMQNVINWFIELTPECIKKGQ